MSAPLTRDHDLPERIERAKEAVRAWAADVAANAKPKPDPRTPLNYRAWHTCRSVCVLVVKHRDKPASIECSRDGSYYPHLYLPSSKIEIQPESTAEFVLAIMPKWLAQKSELIGMTLPLTVARVWADAQADQWEALRKLRLTINNKIYFAKKRPSALSRSHAA